jgi:hypothetical protein
MTTTDLPEIANARSGLCMCGRDDCVEYGPHPFGYGPCCKECQREWSRQHGGARWESDASKVARLRAEQARAQADGRLRSEVVKAWNMGLPPFDRPATVYEGVSDRWRREYEAWADALKVESA